MTHGERNGDEMLRFSYSEMAACARREVAQRKRVYRRLVAEQRMEKADADREIALMSAIAEYFESKEQMKLGL